MTKSLHTIAHSLFQPSRKIPNVTVTGVKLNSSQVEDGDLFIAIPGTNVDGHDFISDAIDSGAIKRSPSSTWEEFNFTPVTVTFGIFRDG